jgi:hypothetical protein
MKRNDWIFLTTVLAFSILFYRQDCGLNFFIFSILLTAGTVLMQPVLIRKRSWLMAAAGALAAGFAVFYYGNVLAIVADTLAVLLLAGISSYAGGSVIISMLITIISVCISFVSMIVDSIARLEKRGPSDPKNKSQGKRIVIVLVALVVVLVFFFMYRSSNVLFYDLTKNISLDFISLPWLLFTGAGAFFVYGLYNQRLMRDVAGWDGGHRLTLHPADMEKQSWLDKLMSVSSERFAALVLFGLLNLLLLFVNGVDVAFMAGDQHLPAGVTYTEYLHQGVGMLITSIIAAMIIILYFFRGRLHFEQNTGLVRNLALLWILQNALMLVSTAYRNYGYIHEYGLTYKRIGVFVYLLLVLIGLSTVAVKLLRRKTNAFLFRSNSWMYFGVLVMASFVNWDGIIIRYNTLVAKHTDYAYLASLSYNAYPELAEANRKKLLEDSGKYTDRDFQYQQDDIIFLRSCYQLFSDADNVSWQSYCRNRQLVSAQLKNRSLGTGGELNLALQLEKPFVYYPAFRDITVLNIADCGQTDISVVKNFSKLRELNIANNPVKDIRAVTSLPALEDLDIRSGEHYDLTLLYNLKKLHTLHLYAATYNPKELEKLQQALPNLYISYE